MPKKMRATKSHPTVEDRIHDIRKRALLIGFVFEALAVSEQHEGAGGDGLRAQHPEVYYALRDYAEGIITATLAIDAAERGMPNPKAPDAGRLGGVR